MAPQTESTGQCTLTHTPTPIPNATRYDAPSFIMLLAFSTSTSYTSTWSDVQCVRFAQKVPHGESICQHEMRHARSSLLTHSHVGEFQHAAFLTQSCTRAEEMIVCCRVM